LGTCAEGDGPDEEFTVHVVELTDLRPFTFAELRRTLDTGDSPAARLGQRARQADRTASGPHLEDARRHAREHEFSGDSDRRIRYRIGRGRRMGLEEVHDGRRTLGLARSQPGLEL